MRNAFLLGVEIEMTSRVENSSLVSTMQYSAGRYANGFGSVSESLGTLAVVVLRNITPYVETRRLMCYCVLVVLCILVMLRWQFCLTNRQFAVLLAPPLGGQCVLGLPKW